MNVRRLAAVVVLIMAFTGCAGGEEETFSIDLAGGDEVCDGDTCGGDATGNATVDLDAEEGTVCYEISVEGAEGINAAHIHEGGADESGDPVVDLLITGPETDDCVEDIDQELIEEIADDPSGYYLNVHTEQFPDGAARGQLG